MVLAICPEVTKEFLSTMASFDARPLPSQYLRVPSFDRLFGGGSGVLPDSVLWPLPTFAAAPSPSAMLERF